MPSFSWRIPVKGHEIIQVEADTLDEAVEIAINGEGDNYSHEIDDLDWDISDDTRFMGPYPECTRKWLRENEG